MEGDDGAMGPLVDGSLDENGDVTRDVTVVG